MNRPSIRVGRAIVALLLVSTFGLGGCNARTASVGQSIRETQPAEPSVTGTNDSAEQAPTADDLTGIEADLAAIEKDLSELQMPEDDFAEIESALY
jgi:hypothetical protein